MEKIIGDRPALLREIRHLEETLHCHETRRSRAAVDALLAEGFVEFGSSGRVYQRHEILDLLAKEEIDDGGPPLASEYALRSISSEAVLLTYRTRRKSADGHERNVLRSSIWQRSETGWKMLFHQGTVTPDQTAAAESSGARPIMP